MVPGTEAGDPDALFPDPQWAEPETEPEFLMTDPEALTAAPEDSGLAAWALFDEARLAYADGDYEHARSRAVIAALEGVPQAMVLAGLMFERGQGGAADDARAREWYEAGAEMLFPDALIGLARLAVDNRAGLTTADARGFLRRAEDTGDPDAALLLGRMLADGEGGPPDPAGAEDAFERAAEGGSTEAMRRLAHIALDGAAPDRRETARELFQRAAKQGDPDAAWEAGVLAADEGGMDAAADYFRQAAQGGNAAGAALYAHALWQGAGVARDREAAVDWYRRAAEGGDPEGAFYYSVMLYAGAGVTADAERAYYWAQRSAMAEPDPAAGYGARREALIAQASGMLSPAQRAGALSRAEADTAPFAAPD